MENVLSSSISSSNSTSSPGSRRSTEISPFASAGKLKLVLLLELALPDRPDPEPLGLPVLEREVLRDGGPEAFPSTGDEVNVGEVGSALYLPPKSRLGISVGITKVICYIIRIGGKGPTTLNLVCLWVVPDERSLGFRYLHQAVLLYLRQRKIRFIPLQTTVEIKRRLQHPSSTPKRDRTLTVADCLNLPHSSRCPLASDLKLNGEAVEDKAYPE